jgi:hypothetical protein
MFILEANPLPIVQSLLTVSFTFRLEQKMLVINLIYLCISLAVTVKVGGMLHKHGTVFLIHHLQGLESLAKSINNLLLVGFYLVNIGYILIVMNINQFSSNILNLLSIQLGVIFFSLGVIHFILLRVLIMWRPKMFQGVK